MVVRTWHRDPHMGPGASLAAAAAEGGSCALSAGSGKLSRLRCVHPRRRASASYARAASCLVAKHPTTYSVFVTGTYISARHGVALLTLV